MAGKMQHTLPYADWLQKIVNQDDNPCARAPVNGGLAAIF